jgi:nitrite reductase/ring-hydroxylating ferredoxin subunit
VRVQVGRLDDFPDGVPTHVRAGGRGLVVIRLRGGVHVLRDVCPHQMTSFAGAFVDDFVTGTPERPAFDAGEPVLQCPWHRYEFSLGSGRCLTSGTFRVRSYPVEVTEGMIFAEIAARDEPAAAVSG